MRAPAWWRRRRRGRPPAGNGSAAAQARRDQERRLAEARRDWPEVHRARDTLSSWVEQGLRGGRA